MSNKLFENLKRRFSKPLIGLGVVGISSTLAACYGPPPHNASEEEAAREFCEALLIRSCTDENVDIPPHCSFAEDQKESLCARQDELQKTPQDAPMDGTQG